MLMALPAPDDKSIRISFSIYKPIKGYDIEDAIAHITIATAKLEKAGNVKAAILKSLNGSWAAVFSVRKDTFNADCSAQNPAAVNDDSVAPEYLTAVVRLVESGWFHLISSEHKDCSCAQVRVGDIVSVRRIYTDCVNQEVLSYSCLAVTKAYFPQIQGNSSCAFYKSMDGKLIIGLSTWDSAESAYGIVDATTGSPGEAYWKDLGAKKLKYEVCQVVYVTAPISLTNSGNGDSPEFQRSNGL
eukprot:Gb_06989 [translate_table: standard]